MRLLDLLASRRITPLVLALFMALYIGVAFGSDEALTTLIALTQGSLALRCLLLLIVLNVSARLAVETLNFIGRGRALRGAGAVRPGMFEEEFAAGGGDLAGAAKWLESAGYRLHQSEGAVGASRGVTLFPARLLFLIGVLLLSLGIFLSLSMRKSARDSVVEGQPLPAQLHTAGRVEAIELRELHDAPLLARDLAIKVSDGAGGVSNFGLYPPGKVSGYFLYPRFLGVAPLVQLSAPDLPQVADYYLLMLYPPGREDSVEIAGTPYKIMFRLLENPDSDPFISGAFRFGFKILKSGQPVADGILPMGGSFSGKGMTLALPEVKRLVSADFVFDPGVSLLWLALLLLPFSFFVYLPLRLLNPRREILLTVNAGRIVAYCRAEGRKTEHAGVFHEVLDLLDKEA